jgi:hypothetical protein
MNLLSYGPPGHEKLALLDDSAQRIDGVGLLYSLDAPIGDVTGCDIA